jgi:hypothetical protein
LVILQSVIWQFENLVTAFSRLQLPNYPITKLQNLFHFLMRRMLPATLAEFLQLDAIRGRLPVLRGRIVPLFAITALHRNNLSGHETSS